MNHHEYRQIDAINWSSLKHMAESPMLYRHMLDHGRDDTPALAFGRLVHTLVFEPALFNSECAIYEGERRAIERVAHRGVVVDAGGLVGREREGAAQFEVGVVGQSATSSSSPMWPYCSTRA